MSSGLFGLFGLSNVARPPPPPRRPLFCRSACTRRPAVSVAQDHRKVKRATRAPRIPPPRLLRTHPIASALSGAQVQSAFGAFGFSEKVLSILPLCAVFTRRLSAVEIVSIVRLLTMTMLFQSREKIRDPEERGGSRDTSAEIAAPK